MTSKSRCSNIIQLIGFACSQTYMFAFFALSVNSTLSQSRVSNELSTIVGLFCMALCLLVYYFAKPQKGHLLYNSLFICLCAACSLVFSVLSWYVQSQQLFFQVIASAFHGVTATLLLCTWVNQLSVYKINRIAHIFFLGTGLAALLFFLRFGIVSALVSAACLFVVQKTFTKTGFDDEEKDSAAFEEPETKSSSMTLLSYRVKMGTALFGFAVGLYIGCTALADHLSQNSFYYALIFVIFICIAATQLYSIQLDAQAKGKPEADDTQSSSAWNFTLCYAYRVAVCLLIAGFLLSPILAQQEVITGESLVVAGFIAVFAVFCMLFIMLAQSSGVSTVYVVSYGLYTLIAGMLVGTLIALISCYESAFSALNVVAALSGIMVIFAYSFLFTHQDFVELTAVVDAADNFEEACNLMIKEYKLSNREAEILPLALKGRTADRIASEFVISKSTVDTHLRRIYTKCGVHSRQELIDLEEQTALRL